MVAKIRAKTFIRRLWNWVYDIRRSIFRPFVVILGWLEVRLRRYGRKLLFASFEIRFTALAVLFLEHSRLFCINWRYGCQDTIENVCLPALILVLRHLLFYFRTLEVILRRLEVQLPRKGRKRLFAGFEIGFMAFAVLFLEHWRLFCVDRRYGCLDTGEKIFSPFLKLGFRHSPFYF